MAGTFARTLGAASCLWLAAAWPCLAASPAAPVALQPLVFADADYPFESILALEDGSVGLDLSVDSAGHVAVAKIASSSGSARLDEAAMQVAKSRWLFRPATGASGEPAAGEIEVEAAWKLPLSPGYATQRAVYDADIKALAQRRNVDLKPPVVVGAQTLQWLSPVRREEGVVVVRYQVLENGHVGRTALVRRSRFNDMDDAVTLSMRMFWKFTPATVNGKPARYWKFAEFYLGKGQSYSCPYHSVDHGGAECGADATSDLDQAKIKIRLAPDNPDGYTERCFALANIGRAQEALADCDKSLSLRPNDAATLDTRGFAYFRLGQYMRAIDDYGAAIKANAKAVSSFYGRGAARLKLGDAGGNADISSAKALDPTIAEKMAKVGILP